MTVTEDRPDTADVETDLNEEVDHFATPGFAGALATSDHKQIGRFYILFSLLLGLLTFVLAFVVGLEKTDVSSISILDWSWSGDNLIQTFFQVWSLHRISLLFFVVLPLFIGLATYIVPLQVGSSSIAFPRAAAAAFWTWLVGAGIHIATVLIDGGLGVPNNPFVSITNDGQPIQTPDATEAAASLGPNPEAVELSLLSLGVVIVALMLATVCIITTVVAQRPEGMDLEDVPMFSWSMLVAGGIWMLSFPVLLANLAVIWVDFQGLDAVRYGNVELIWGQLGWIFQQPMVFAFAIPALGIVVDIIGTTSAADRLPGRGIFMIAIGGFGALSFGAYVQPYFNSAIFTQVLFVVGSLALMLPLLAVFGGLGKALVAGKPDFTPHFALAMFSILMLMAGAAAAGVRVFGSFVGALREFDKDLWPTFFEETGELNNSIITTGVMNYALLGGLLAGVAGLYYWGPKIFGRSLATPVGGLAGLALLGGTVLHALPQVVNGFVDEGPLPFRPGNYAIASADEVDLIEVMNWISTAGAAILFAGIGLVLLDVLGATVLGAKDDTEDNPWGGSTLEWATSSPPPLGNFVAAPVVTSAEPLVDLNEEENA